MDNLSKIQTLLNSDDEMNVNMGLELLEMLAQSPEDISAALGLETEIDTVYDLYTALEDLPHFERVLIFSLSKWLEFGVDWVADLKASILTAEASVCFQRPSGN